MAGDRPFQEFQEGERSWLGVSEAVGCHPHLPEHLPAEQCRAGLLTAGDGVQGVQALPVSHPGVLTQGAGVLPLQVAAHLGEASVARRSARPS